jgi:hypothetical protein
MSEFFDDATEALGLTEAAIAAGSIYTVDATDTLTLTDEWLAISFEATDSLGLSDAATVLQDIGVAGDDTLVLAELYPDVWVWNTSHIDTLELTVETFDPATLEYTEVDVGLREEALAGGFVSVSTSDNIPFVESATRWVLPVAGFDEAAIDTLSLTEKAVEPIELKVSEGIGLTDSASAEISRPATDDLGFTDTASSVVDYNDLQASDSLGLSEFNNPLLIQIQVTCRPEFTYSPYIDPYTAEHGTTGFRLQYPATGGVTDELVLRNPNFGNKDRVAPQRANNLSRGGDLIIFSDPVWGDPVESLLYSFSVLTEVEALALQTWFDNYLGQEIRLIDQENRLWRGVILEVTDPIVQDRRKSWTASFEFEGAKV